MRKFLLGAIGVVALGIAAPASAADLPARPYKAAPVMMPAMYDWSGFYLGLNGGGGWSHNCWSETSVVGVPVAPAIPEGCHNATGGVAGGQLGYRWQYGTWVFGLEGMGDWANLKGANISLNLLAPPHSNRTKIDAVSLITGQVGYAWNNVLWYVEGGFAVTNDTYNGVLPNGVLFDRKGEARFGGAIGTGVDIGFASDWSVGVKYDHAFMGSRNVSLVSVVAPVGALTRGESIRQDVDMVTVHVNYRWGGPIIAKY